MSNDASVACIACGARGVRGADRCLRCGGKLLTGRRPVSPFGGSRRRVASGRLRLVAAIAIAVVVALPIAFIPLLTWPVAPPGSVAPTPQSTSVLPTRFTTLAVMSAPPLRGELVRPDDVQESCVGRALSDEPEQTAGPPAVIDGNPRTSWHCDGDGARLRPPQTLALFFPRAVNLVGVGVTGYDPIRPCRYVTLIEVVIGAAGYRLSLPAVPNPQLRWFALPSARADRATLVVLRTAVPEGQRAAGCADTAIAEVAFAARR